MADVTSKNAAFTRIPPITGKGLAQDRHPWMQGNTPHLLPLCLRLVLLETITAPVVGIPDPSRRDAGCFLLP
jgi:hypothetical protein